MKNDISKFKLRSPELTSLVTFICYRLLHLLLCIEQGYFFVETRGINATINLYFQGKREGFAENDYFLSSNPIYQERYKNKKIAVYSFIIWIMILDPKNLLIESKTD